MNSLRQFPFKYAKNQIQFQTAFAKGGLSLVIWIRIKNFLGMLELEPIRTSIHNPGF